MYDIDNGSPGDIIKGENNRNRDGRRSHYIIYLDKAENNASEFYGVMLTHSPNYGNVPLQAEHFINFDKTGMRHTVTFDASFIVADKFIKKADWAPFTLVGQLSQEGLEFVTRLIADKNPTRYPDNE